MEILKTKMVLGQSKIIIKFSINITINAYFNDQFLNISFYNYYIVYLIKFPWMNAIMTKIWK
jgi:hypothetical protein